MTSVRFIDLNHTVNEVSILKIEWLQAELRILIRKILS